MRSLFSLGFLIVFCFFQLLYADDPVTVRPIWIHDGDTFQAHLINKAVVNCRIWGIDAPELDQPWGKVAKAALIEMIHRRPVKIKIVSTSYARSVVMVECGGRDIALELIKMGLAWYYEQYASGRKDYADAQNEAKSAKRGLWSERHPVAPWLWRQNRRSDYVNRLQTITGCAKHSQNIAISQPPVIINQ